MPVLKCDNGKYRIGNGQCKYTTKEKAETAYRAYKTQKHDARRGKYDTCVKRRMFEGYSRHEAETTCSKFLSDANDSEDEFNLLFVDGEDAYDIVKKLNPDWSHEKIVAMAEAYTSLPREDAIELSTIIKRSRSLSLAKFSTLIKNIKTRIGLKAPHMGILPQKTMLPMKNLNRLQTKLEKTVTQEQKWLTAEQYEQYLYII